MREAGSTSTGDGASGEVLRLEAAGRVDVAPLLSVSELLAQLSPPSHPTHLLTVACCCTARPQVEVSSLPRGLHARCVAFHPTKPLLAVVGALTWCWR